MGLTYAQLEKLKEELLKMPAPPRDNITPTKQEAVRFIADAIEELQERKFSLEQIAEALSGKGLEISTPTLKSYLSRINAKKARRKTGSRPKKDASSTVTPDAGAKAVEKARAAMASAEPDKHQTPQEAAKKDPTSVFRIKDRENI
jgi:hypothetical protein